MSDIVVPSSPKDLEAIKTAIHDFSEIKSKIEVYDQSVKDGVKALAEQYGIDKKWINKMLADYHKQQFEKKQHEADSYESLYESVFG